MKAMKKILAMLLTLTLVAALIPAAFADDTPAPAGTITLENKLDTAPDATYSVYRIFDLVSYDVDKSAYVYKLSDKWAGFTADTYFTVDSETKLLKNADGLTDATVADFAKNALAYAETANIAADGTLDTKNNTSLGVDTLGYYLVNSQVGTILSLTTTKPNATFKDKNEVPSIEKEVQEDSLVDATGNGWGKVDDADIGQTINYRTTVSVKKGAHNYIVHDKMDSQLTFDQIVSVKCGTADVGYTLLTTKEHTDCAFELKLDDDAIAGLAGKDVVISYTAHLNETAQVNVGYNNTTWMQYGDNPFYTPECTTKTYTWAIEIYKFTQNGDTKTPLEGAKFKLTKDGETAIPLVEVEEGKEYRMPKNASETTVTEFTTTNTGTVVIKGLDADTYKLVEVEAPDGYNKIEAPIEITLTEENYSGTTLVEASKTGDNKILVENKTGNLLPETGGIGTTLFYVFGSILVIGAGVLLVTKKRMGAAE